MCLCASVFSMCLCVYVSSTIYNPLGLKSMTECKYSHTVFYPKMASASSGTNIMYLKTYFLGSSIKKALLLCQIMLQVLSPSIRPGRADFFQMCQHIFSPCVYSISWPPLMTSEHVQGGSLLMKRPPYEHSRQPGHCPFNQLVNVIRRMWQLWDRGNVLRGLLSCTVGYSGMYNSWSVPVI